MNDTSSKTAEKMHEMMQKKTPLERLIMGCSMYQTSKYLVTQGIIERHPNLSKAGLRREFFLRFYGDDFDPVRRDRIAKYLEEHEGASEHRKLEQ